MKTHAYLKSLKTDHIFRMTDDTGMEIKKYLDVDKKKILENSLTNQSQ